MGRFGRAKSWSDDSPMNRRDLNTGSQELVSLWRGYQQNPGTGSLNDPFAVNPLRRSFALVALSAIAVFGPPLFGSSPMLALTWLAVPGLVFGLPVLGMCLGERAIAWIRRLFNPSIDQLGLSPRVHHLLVRHGYVSISELQAASDEDLLLIANLYAGGLHEVRRSIAVWSYRRWQERGFRGVRQ
jgi:Bacterial RNA polymerase, alpha chain C terminal domain